MTNLYKYLLASLMLTLHFTCFSQLTQLKVETHNDFINRENNYVGTTFTRNIEVFNVDNVSFSGYIKIKENSGTSLGVTMKIKSLLPASSPAAVVTLVSVDPANPDANNIILPDGNPLGLVMIPAQDNEIVIRVQNFKQNLHKILISQDVMITSCLNANNTSSFSVSFVSTTSETAPVQTDYQLIQGATYSQIVNKGAKPMHKIFDYEDSYVRGGWSLAGSPLLKKEEFTCTGNNNFKTLKLSMGLSDDPKFTGASFHDFKLLFSNKGDLFTIDRNSIVIEKKKKSDNSFSVTWVPADQYDVKLRTEDFTSENCLTPDQKFDQVKYNIGELTPDEYLVIQYDLYNCCKKADLFDGAFWQNDNMVFFSYVDDCGILFDFHYENGPAADNNQLGPNSYYYDNKRGIEIRADINSSPAQMRGPNATKSYPDLGNYVVDNPLNSNVYKYWSTYGGLEAIYNLLEAQLVVRIKSGASLRYVTNTSAGTLGTYDFANNNTLGNFSYYPAIGFVDKSNSAKQWNPVNPLGTVVSTSPSGYETREFLFDLTSMPGITPTISDFDRLMLLYYNMNSMQLTFSMEGICSAQDDGNWEVQYLFNTDKTCSQCLLPISKVSDITVVNCPGCKVPGAAAQGNLERTFYGPFDINNDGMPDQPETTVNTLSAVRAYNNLDSDPTNDVQTNMASVGDDMTFSGNFYLTAASDCNASAGGRVACRDNELQYQWAYLQVKVPKGYFDGNIRNLQVKFRAAGSSTSDAITPHTVTFYNAPSLDIFYIKVNVSVTGNSYFSSKDAFDIVFNSKLIKNPTERERHEIQFMAYFTKAEEIISVLEVDHPDLYNRSYADCATDELRGTAGNCDTETLQMICETWGSYLNLINIVTRLNDAGYTAYTNAKVCIPAAKSNSTGSYGGEKSNFGNSADYFGINLYKNEFRKAPVMQYIHVVIPEGYYLNELAIGTQSGAGQDVLSITRATLTGSNQAKNNMINAGRVLDFDVRNLNSLADGTSNPAAPLHYTDESSTHDFFRITLLADCKYLAQKGILQTDMGNVTVAGQKIYSTVEYDNSYVGVNGVFNIGGDNVFTQTPIIPSTPVPFVVNKKGAENNKFKLQKKTDFVNEFELIQNYNPSNNYKDNYFGRMFIGVDPVLIKTIFSDFKVEVSGTELIHINTDPALNFNQSFGFFESYVHGYLPVQVKVSGKINMTSVLNCEGAKKAVYDLIYGIHCNESQVTAQSILGNTMCNKWLERVELEIDEVDLLLISDVDAIYPIVSGSKATHQAIFTATRSEVSKLDIQLTNTPAAVVAIGSVSLVKNSGSASATLVLTEGTNYSVSPDQQTINIHTLPDGVYFESINALDDYYNEVHVIFDVKNNGCTPVNIQTALKATGTPFYSETQCKVIKNKTIQSPLGADAPSVVISGPEDICPNTSASYSAVVAGVSLENITYTWYKVANNNQMVIQGPDANNTLAVTNLNEDATYSVSVTSGNCTATDDISVHIYHLPLLSMVVPTDFCIGSAPSLLTGMPAGGYFTGNGVSLASSGDYIFTASVSGSNAVTYHYTDQVTGCSNTITETIEVSNCCKYALKSTDVMCNEDAVRCITLQAVKPVDNGIKGMDFTLRYDRTLMRPTGLPGRGNVTLGNVVLNNGMTASMGSYALTERSVTGTNLNELHVSIFYTGQAPAVADFDGIGDVICIEFKINGSATSGLGGTTKSILIGDIFGGVFSQGVVDDEHKVFMIRSCVENNGEGVINITKNNFLNGRVIFHNDANAPLRYDGSTVPNPFLKTSIKPINTYYGASYCNPTANPEQTPDINGSFKIDMTGANGLLIKRDIVGDYYNSCTDPSDAIDQSGNVYQNNTPGNLLLALNGYDAYLMESITTMRSPSDVVYVMDRKVPGVTVNTTANALFPTPFQMIASDVNMDRKVRAVDITLVQERAVSKLCEYPQVWNYNLGLDPVVYPLNTEDQRSLDWRFVDRSQVATNLVYQKSGVYPLPAGTTGTAAAYYWRDNVPSPSLCLMGPAAGNACKSYPSNFDIHAIMLGDIDGSWRANLNGSQQNLRTESERKVVIKAGNKQQIGVNTYRIPVTFVSQDPATVSFDFALNYDEEQLSIKNVGNYESANVAGAKVVYNDFENKELLFTSYTMIGFSSSSPVYYLDVFAKNGEFHANMLGSGDAYLNGERVELVVEGSVITGIDDLLSGTQYGFDLIPNPASDQGEIIYNIKTGTTAKIAVYNTLGQVVTEYMDLEGQGSLQVGTSTWSSGMYQVILFTENSQKLIKKWVIQN